MVGGASGLPLLIAAASAAVYCSSAALCNPCFIELWDRALATVSTDPGSFLQAKWRVLSNQQLLSQVWSGVHDCELAA